MGWFKKVSWKKWDLCCAWQDFSEQIMNSFFYKIHYDSFYYNFHFTDSPSKIEGSFKKGKWSEVAQSCLTLCDPMDCSLPGSSVHGIFQARILEWVVISCSRGSSWPRNQTCISCIGRWILYHCATWEAHLCPTLFLKMERHQLHWMRVHLNDLI